MVVFAPRVNGLCENTPDFREVVGTTAFASHALLPGPCDNTPRAHLTRFQVISPAQTFSSPNFLPGRGPICLPKVLEVLPHKDCHLKISPPFAEVFPCQLDLLFNKGMYFKPALEAPNKRHFAYDDCLLLHSIKLKGMKFCPWVLPQKE